MFHSPMDTIFIRMPILPALFAWMYPHYPHGEGLLDERVNQCVNSEQLIADHFCRLSIVYS